MYFAGHSWIRNNNDIKVPLDISIFKLLKAYMRSSPLRKSALRVCMSSLELLAYICISPLIEYPVYTEFSSVCAVSVPLSYYFLLLLISFEKSFTCI